MFVSILMFVLAALCIAGGILILKFKGVDDGLFPALLLFALVINFCVAGGFGLANVNIFSGQIGDLNAYILPIANFGASLLYGLAFIAAILAICAFFAILSAIAG